jgi:hypothetical protein
MQSCSWRASLLVPLPGGGVLRVALRHMGRKALRLFWPPNFVKHLVAADPPVSRIPINLLVA